MKEMLQKPPPLRRNHQFTLLWAGSAASALGSELTRIAMPLVLLALTGSAARAGLISSLLTASMIIVQIPAGVWVDRWDRRRTLQICQLVQFANSAALTMSLLAGHVHLVNFAIFAVIDGGCRAFLGPSRDVAIRGVVPPEQLGLAYSQEEARQHGARLLGPALGGALYTANMLFPFLFDTISFLIAWICTLFARVPRRPALPTQENDGTSAVPAPDESTASMAREALSALTWLIHRPGLREMTLIFMAMNLLGGAFLIPMITHIQSMGGSASLTGMVLSGIGIGGLIGALASHHVIRRSSAGWLAICVPAIFGLCLIAAALPLAPWWPAIPIILLSLTTPALNVASQAITAQLVPPHMLGRMGALMTVASFGLAPFGPLLGGILASRIGGGPTLACVGAALIATALAGLSSRSLRNFRATGGKDPRTTAGENHHAEAATENSADEKKI